MPTKIVRTVIGGTVLETPVEVPETAPAKPTKTKRGRPPKAANPADPTPVILTSAAEDE